MAGFKVTTEAISEEYTPVTVPHEAICDAFVAKGANFDFELLEEAQKLIRESPLRGTRAKSDVAPVWIPHSAAGYIVLTCPECLRSFSALEVEAGRAEEQCMCCGATVPFEMSRTEIQRSEPVSQPLKSRLMRERSRQIRTESRRLRKKPDLKRKT